MKKIALNRHTLRVLTEAEADGVAGGITQTCLPKMACVHTQNYPGCGAETSNCPPPPTSACPGPTRTCPRTTLC
jgi:hypothetical protein